MDTNHASKLQSIIEKTFLVIKDPILYKDFFKAQQKLFWHSQEIDYSSDKSDYDSLNDDERKLIKGVITFFFISDSIIADNADAMTETTTDPIMIAFYRIQAAIEDVHNESYTLMAKCLFNSVDITEYVNNILAYPSVVEKNKFSEVACKIDDLATRVFTVACIEAIFFASSFASVMWLKRSSKCRGILKANEFIMKDETIHWKLGCYRVRTELPLDKNIAQKIVDECVRIEYRYCDEILPHSLCGLDSESLKKHVQFMASLVMSYAGYEVSIKTSPFPFSDMVDLSIRPNFFETRNSNYTRMKDNTHFEFDPNYFLVKLINKQEMSTICSLSDEFSLCPICHHRDSLMEPVDESNMFGYCPKHGNYFMCSHCYDDNKTFAMTIEKKYGSLSLDDDPEGYSLDNLPNNEIHSTEIKGYFFNVDPNNEWVSILAKCNNCGESCYGYVYTKDE